MTQFDTVADTLEEVFAPEDPQPENPPVIPQATQPDHPPSILDFVGDAYWGQGGRYIIDPATGERRPAGEEQPSKE